MKKQNAPRQGRVARVDTKYTQFTAKEDSTLLPFVLTSLAGISKTKAKGILAGGGVMVNNVTITRHDHPVHVGDIVEISKHPNPGSKSRFDYSQYFKIIYEDDDLVVVDKADQVLSMPVGRNSLNMKDLLDRYFVETHQQCTAHVVHRLDARTTGLMMYAKSVEIQQALTEDWRKTIIDRRYVAVAEGELERDSGSIKGWLKDTDSLKVMSSPRDNGGKWAWTDYRTLKRGNGFSLLELHLHTGRKNQIRAHLSAIHHPIAGDYKYGAQEDNVERLCLHAFRLAFHHPVTDEPLSFETPFPSFFSSFFRMK